MCAGQNLKRTFHCQSATKAREEYCPMDEESLTVYFKQPAIDPFIPKNKDLWSANFKNSLSRAMNSAFVTVFLCDYW